MIHTIQNQYFQLIFHPHRNTWSLFGLQFREPFLEEIQIGASSRLAGPAWTRPFRNPVNPLDGTVGHEVTKKSAASPCHGQMRIMEIHLAPHDSGLSAGVMFALPEDHPLLLWKIKLTNQGSQTFEIDHLELLRAGMFQRRKRLLGSPYDPRQDRTRRAGRGTIRPHADPGELAFFSNGWQSWSHSGVYGPRDRYRRTRLRFLSKQVWYNPDTPYPREPGHIASDMFGVLGDRRHRTGILAGFLSQREHFGSLETWLDDPLYPALRMWANGDQAHLLPGEEVSTDWACLQFVDLDAPDPLGPYLAAAAREHGLPESSRESPAAGWCSWYHFYQDISPGKIRANLQSAEELREAAPGPFRPAVPLDLIQIDDGFQAQVGDWFEFSPAFPEGVAPLAADIRAAGFTPGLWLAPFILHSRSRIKRNHPEWLLRNWLGRPVKAGFIWNSFTNALDLTHPGALAYACDAARAAAHEWGYPYLKLDFLYAAALRGRYRDRTKTRAQVLRGGLEAVRAAVGPDVTLLGCGVPPGCGIGVFDMMRVGADVAPRWRPEWNQRDFFFPGEPHMASTRNALQNTLTRAALHRRWWINDPDCLLVRPDMALTEEEVHTLATVISLSGGSLLLSDNLPDLPPERLEIVHRLLPLIGDAPRVIDWFDSPRPGRVRLDLNSSGQNWHLAALINWENRPAREIPFNVEDFHLPGGDYLYRAFWSGQAGYLRDGNIILPEIPPHGVYLAALTPLQDKKKAHYVGSSLHISQGLEMTEWNESGSKLEFQLERPGYAWGEVDLYLPRPAREVILNQKPALWSKIFPSIIRVEVEFDQHAHLRIT